MWYSLHEFGAVLPQPPEYLDYMCVSALHLLLLKPFYECQCSSSVGLEDNLWKASPSTMGVLGMELYLLSYPASPLAYLWFLY